MQDRGADTEWVMMSHWLQKPFKPIKAALRDFPNGKIIFQTY